MENKPELEFVRSISCVLLAISAQQRDAPGELLLRRERRGLIPFLDILLQLIKTGSSVDEAVFAAKDQRSIMHCELTNFSKWQMRNPTAILNSSELQEPEGPVIFPGMQEGFVAKRKKFFQRNEGKMSWTAPHDQQIPVTISIEWSIHMHAGVLSSWFGLGGHTNKLTVCVNKSCDYQEYDEETHSNCVCLGDLCVLGTMGTADQAHAKIYILPKSHFDLAEGMLKANNTIHYSYKSCSPSY